MLNIEASETDILPVHVSTAPRPMPAIVWRSEIRTLPPGIRTPRRLHLVAAPTLDRKGLQRRRRTLMRDRMVESAYLAAALGTAIVIWWSAR